MLIRTGTNALPASIAAYGERASRRFVEFFTAAIRNRNTRMAYAQAVKQFFDRCEQHRLGLDDIEPISIAAYIEQLGNAMAKPTVKQNLAAIRQLFDYLVTGGILPSNPAGSVRGPKYVVSRGKIPVLSGDEMRQLLDSIDISELIGLRDRALIGLMGYSFARVSAVAILRVEDYFQQGRRSWLRLHEKGGKRHEVPCHHRLDEYLDAWIAAAGIGDDKKGPLFRTLKGDKLTGSPITRSDVLSMNDQTARQGGRPALFHLLSYISRDRDYRLSSEWRYARTRAADCGAQSPRTTKLYDRTKDEISLDEVERIKF